MQALPATFLTGSEHNESKDHLRAILNRCCDLSGRKTQLQSFFSMGGRMLALANASLLADSQVFVFQYRNGVIGWLLIGLIAGWLAGKIARGRGFGCIADIVLGLVGSFIGGWVFVQLKIFGGGFWYSLAAATLGAVILVSIAHLFTGNSHP
jgi:uncharacterized membrane protein YeaQ/YmgE (transglycosylase-associated protein family)